ncbi:MAG TPA: hypothetical protein VJ841_02230 [Candidatus Saccharimonadales bacterium]|nr:hypothetical protein [Candidatus Saccharimonadales bacterium]
MMSTRDRESSGKKAAETNRKKDARYYEKIGSLGGRLGGKLVDAAKRAFTRSPRLASRAAQIRHIEPGQVAVYIVRTQWHPTITTHTREQARMQKRSYLNMGYKSTITRTVYDESGVIIEEKEVR